MRRQRKTRQQSNIGRENAQSHSCEWLKPVSGKMGLPPPPHTALVLSVILVIILLDPSTEPGVAAMPAPSPAEFRGVIGGNRSPRPGGVSGYPRAWYIGQFREFEPRRVHALTFSCS